MLDTEDGGISYFRELFKKLIIVHESITRPDGCKHIGHPGKCKAIHIASSGYYLKQDQQKPEKSRLVIFKSTNRSERIPCRS